MFKKVIIVSMVSVLALAESSSVKANIEKYIDDIVASQDKVGGLIITNRVKKGNHESFLATVKGDSKSNRYDSGPSEDLNGLAIENNIEYAENSMHSTSVVVALPKNIHTPKEAMDKIIKDKVFTLVSDYNTKDYKFSTRLKDIDTDLAKVAVVTKDIAVTGTYNPNDIFGQDSSVVVGMVNLIPKEKRYKGDNVLVKGLDISSKSVKNGDKLDMKTHISLDSVDTNIMKKITDIKNFNLDTTIGNLDIAIYKELVAIIEKSPEDYFEDPKFMDLGIKLLSAKGVFISIDDLSVDNLMLNNQKMDKGKITAKVSLKHSPELAKMIAMSPFMAISALEVTARVELSKDMYGAVMKDKRAFMLGMFPKKEEKGNIVYVISFKDGKLTINGQVLAI